MRKKKLTISEVDERHLATLDPDSYTHKTYRQYAELSAKHEALVDRMGDPKYEGKGGLVPDKHAGEFKKLSDDAARAGTAMFRAFDNAMATAGKTMHVDEADVKQIMYDTLMGNVESLPDEYAQLSGLQRGRECERVAQDLIQLLKHDKAQVAEVETDVPYCDDCRESLS